MNIVSKISDSKTYVIWIAIIMVYLYLMLTGASSLILDTRQLTYNTLIEQFNHGTVMQILDRQRKFIWLGYVFVPVMLGVKLLLISFTLTIGEVFYDINLSFKKAFKAVLLAEPIFILMSVVKLVWVKFFVENLTLEYLQFFIPLSLSSMFNPASLSKWLIYPLQTLNLFEIAYIFMLSYNVSKITGYSAEKSTYFVLQTYGIGLLLWIVVVAFLILNFAV